MFSWNRWIAPAVFGLSLVVLPGATSAQQKAMVTQIPKVINITAKRFAYAPSMIKLKKGETVTLRLRSEDVTHGFFSRPLKIDATLKPGETEEITVTPETQGTFPVICDHFCGSGHGSMSMTFVVE